MGMLTLTAPKRPQEAPDPYAVYRVVVACNRFPNRPGKRQQMAGMLL